jgi:uncharacterized protein YbjT (DUF2867 family)
MILITTAGKVGSETARQLAERDEPVRLVVRSAEKAAVWDGTDVTAVIGDLEDRESVARMLDGVRSVVLVTRPVVSQELNVIEAAATAGVEHVVKITTKASADSPIARRRDHIAIERALIDTGLGYTLLRSNGYMQNFLMMAPGIAAASAFSMATGAGRIGHIDARDVAAVAAEIAAAPAGHAGATYWPSGPEALSGADVADVLSRVLDRTVTFHAISYEAQRDALMAVGMPPAVAEDTARVLALMQDGDCEYVTGDVKAILGREPRSFEAFAREHAVAFSPRQPAVL